TCFLAHLGYLRAPVTPRGGVLFVLWGLIAGALVAARHTAADEIIRMSGAVNAIDGYDGYKMINDEAIVAAKPDWVLSIERGKESLAAEAIYQHPAFAMTKVASDKTFVAMDGLYLLGFGPRTAAAARDVAIRLYPQLATEADRFKSAVLAANCRQ
ncbi:hemin ABC transporter substrate-binding protein, partial [Rhodopseudomonas sp. BAL398]|nr:hemin ABC transporter substrate-binding protein [Rhodopseudomonas sp. BAL398]